MAKRKLYGAAAAAVARARGGVRKVRRAVRRVGRSRAGGMLSGLVGEAAPIGGYALLRSRLAASIGHPLGEKIVKKGDEPIADEVGLLIPAIILRNKPGLIGAIARVALHHEGVRVVAYYADVTHSYGKAVADAPKGSYTALW